MFLVADRDSACGTWHENDIYLYLYIYIYNECARISFSTSQVFKQRNQLVVARIGYSQTPKTHR